MPSYPASKGPMARFSAKLRLCSPAYEPAAGQPLQVRLSAAAALEVADRAYVLEAGRLTLEGAAADLRQNRDLQRSYLGE